MSRATSYEAEFADLFERCKRGDAAACAELYLRGDEAYAAFRALPDIDPAKVRVDNVPKLGDQVEEFVHAAHQAILAGRDARALDKVVEFARWASGVVDDTDGLEGLAREFVKVERALSRPGVVLTDADRAALQALRDRGQVDEAVEFVLSRVQP